jgi:putative sigma-54 modulation protein
MDVKLVERKCTVYAVNKDYALKKVGKLERYFKGNAAPEATVIFRIENKNYRVELTVRAGGTYFRAEETTSDMMASIDAAVASVERQIRKYKTKLAKRTRTDVVTVPAQEVAEEPETEFSVVRSKKFPLKPMSVEEAILQMQLLGHNFFMFRNEDDEGIVSVVYIRNDGGYGLIEEE